MSAEDRPARPSGPAASPIDDLGRCYADFLQRYPAYATTSAVDRLRALDYERIDRLGHVYLDYTGGGLYADSQIRRHHEMLREGVFGNPHSQNPTSMASSALIEEARVATRQFFNADPDEYEIIFTPNASGALKLIGESYPFRGGGVYLLSFDNHNSVNGIREFARRRGAAVTYVPVRREDLRLDEDVLERALRAGVADGCDCDRLFAYPAQSNFSGVQHPLEWVKLAHENGWDVILDCAAYVPTNVLDLSAVHPDFVCVSFYKMFGYPTGVGALLARREVLAKLVRPWFAGGTITVASVQREDWYHLADAPTGFEDGTPDYLNLPAVTGGLRHMQSIGVSTIHRRVRALAGWLLEEIVRIRHSNGSSVVQLFGPADMDRRGATIALQLLDPAGLPYDVYEIELAAGRQLISIRTGCFCNPGDGEVAHDLTRDDMALCFRDEGAVTSLLECQRVIHDATGKVPNTLRVSLGVISDFADVYRFLRFVAGYRDRVS